MIFSPFVITFAFECDFRLAPAPSIYHTAQSAQQDIEDTHEHYIQEVSVHQTQHVLSLLLRRRGCIELRSIIEGTASAI
ncbi:hypothetical protein A0H81_09839 [Grifola frondosa]|uniref:Uncharacterized protein n=1 Tax=Grifola frondosa TaxID=5627 RepID=A0A1C7M4V0_GRIFR|nr:hypothetical protein A0H81_09839 [Grifola frondosa]